MVGKSEQLRVKALLTEAITVLCKNGLQYRRQFCVEGLLGITLDNEDVFLININQTIGEPDEPEGRADVEPHSIEQTQGPNNGKSPARSKRIRRRSRESPHSSPAKRRFLKDEGDSLPQDSKANVVLIKEESVSEDELVETYQNSDNINSSQTALSHSDSSMLHTSQSDSLLQDNSFSQSDSFSQLDNSQDALATQELLKGTGPVPVSMGLPVSAVAGCSSWDPTASLPIATGTQDGSPSQGQGEDNEDTSMPIVMIPAGGSRGITRDVVFDVQQAIMNMEGCVAMSRVLCRNRHYKVLDVIHAMEAMTQPRDSQFYIGEYVRIGHKFHCFYKCPPHMLGEMALQPYLLTPEQYEHMFNCNPKPITGAPRNWYFYVAKLMRHYPYDPATFPLERMGFEGEVYQELSHLREELQGQEFVSSE